MSSLHKKDTRLVDDVSNIDKIKVCSRRLVDYLKKRKLKNLEFLPIAILDHKGRMASKDYFIVNPIIPQDALDIKASQPRYSALAKKEINGVKQLVIDEKRVDPEVEIFRLQAFFSPVVVTRPLSEAMEQQGFEGLYFEDPLEYQG